MPMNMDKRTLRAAIRQQKRAMTPEDIAEKSAALCAMVLASPEFQAAKTIYGYLPFNQEVDLRPLLQRSLDMGKQVALPKCYGSQMRFILVTDLSCVQPSPFGAPEPTEDEPVARDKDALIIVPGLAFDDLGHRIGYGGGYYDRFLAAEPEHPTMALCYDFQVVSRLEPEEHDIPVQTLFFR